MTSAARWVAHAVFAVLLLAAAGKLLDISHFLESLGEWQMLTPATASVVAYVLPALELWLALLWFSDHERARVLWSTNVMLCGLSVAYAFEMTLRAEPPKCTCLGLWEKHFSDLATGRYVLLRNSVLIALLAIAGLVGTSRCTRTINEP